MPAQASLGVAKVTWVGAVESGQRSLMARNRLLSGRAERGAWSPAGAGRRCGGGPRRGTGLWAQVDAACFGVVSGIVSHMTTDSVDVPRQLLLDQLGMTWGFADRFVWPQVDLALCTWEPSKNCVTVRAQGDRWSADWPDEEGSPLPEATVGWLLWHIDWWWGNALRACRGLASGRASRHLWDGSVQTIEATKLAWEEMLRATPLDKMIEGLMPEPKPLWFVAGWVNFELTKNVSEIHQLINRRANTAN